MKKTLEGTKIAKWIPLLAAIKQADYLIEIVSLTNDKLEIKISRPQGLQRALSFVEDYFFIDEAVSVPYVGNTKEMVAKDLKFINESMDLL